MKLMENYELIEGSGSYLIYRDLRDGTYIVWDIEDKCLLDDTVTDDLGVAEKTVENLNEEDLQYAITIGRNETVGMSYDEMNYFECIDDGD